jgi:hypothetical protein
LIAAAIAQISVSVENICRIVRLTRKDLDFKRSLRLAASGRNRMAEPAQASFRGVAQNPHCDVLFATLQFGRHCSEHADPAPDGPNMLGKTE